MPLDQFVVVEPNVKKERIASIAQSELMVNAFEPHNAQ